jgi:hypothetical protein
MSVIRRVDPLPWRAGELEVRVNPELVMLIDGETCLAKLYKGKELLSKTAIQAFGYLVAQTHGGSCRRSPRCLTSAAAGPVRHLHRMADGAARTGGGRFLHHHVEDWPSGLTPKEPAAPWGGQE